MYFILTLAHDMGLKELGGTTFSVQSRIDLK